MRHLRWQVLLGVFLVALSGLLYLLHFAIFRDTHHIFIYLVGDIAFVPLEVLLVTLIIHRLLESREKRLRLDKLNMVIEVFFSEVGSRLLAYFSDQDPGLDDIKKHLVVSSRWTDRDFDEAAKKLKAHDYGVDIRGVRLGELRDFLSRKRELLVRLLEHPDLHEHEAFSDLLRAVFHLTEELSSRKDLASLPETDLEHLAGDIKRAYTRQVHQWIAYMRHLKDNYPYLFSLAMRTNPFDEEASPLVT